jgi:hypothetical protein
LASLEKKIVRAAAKLGKKDALYAFELDALSGATFRKKGEKGREEKKRVFEDEMDELLLIFDDLRKNRDRENQSNRQLFQAAREEFGRRHELTATDVEKLAKDDAFYKRLRKRRSSRVLKLKK